MQVTKITSKKNKVYRVTALYGLHQIIDEKGEIKSHTYSLFKIYKKANIKEFYEFDEGVTLICVDAYSEELTNGCEYYVYPCKHNGINNVFIVDDNDCILYQSKALFKEKE